MSGTSASRLQDVFNGVLQSRWIYALPVPIFFAMSGTLIGKWFHGLDESGVIAANFVVSAAILTPITIMLAYPAHNFLIQGPSLIAVLMLLVGTLASSAAGRVFYQVALTTTDNDNGFVTMFFLAISALSSLISVGLSRWISDLRVVEGPTFLLGLVLVTAPLLIFSVRTWRGGESNRGRLAAVNALEERPPVQGTRSADSAAPDVHQKRMRMPAAGS